MLKSLKMIPVSKNEKKAFFNESELVLNCFVCNTGNHTTNVCLEARDVIDNVELSLIFQTAPEKEVSWARLESRDGQEIGPPLPNHQSETFCFRYCLMKVRTEMVRHHIEKSCQIGKRQPWKRGRTVFPH